MHLGSFLDYRLQNVTLGNMSIVGNSVPVRSLKDYLSDDSRLLVVPQWQREYVWSASEEGQVGVLLADLFDFLETDDDDYLMGSIWLSRSNNPKESLIVDGQQRSLTFTLLMMSVLKYVTNNPEVRVTNNPDHDQVIVDMRNCISSSTKDYLRKVSMPQAGANNIMISLFAWMQVADGQLSNIFINESDDWTPTQQNIVSVARWIYEKKLKVDENSTDFATNNKWVEDAKLLDSMKRILDRVKFLEIQLEDPNKAIELFDRINSRSAALDSGDLVKNLIFQSVKNDEDFESISQSWALMSESINKCTLKRMREPKFLLRALALTNYEALETVAEIVEESSNSKAPKITYNQLTKYWGSRLIEGPQGEKPLNPTTFANKLVSTGQWLHALSLENTPKQKSLEHLYFSRYMGSVQHFPIVLAGNAFPSEAMRHLVRQVHNRTAFYLLSDERTQDFESMVPNWTRDLARSGSKVTISRLDEIYDEYKISSERMNAFFENVRLWSYKGSDKKKIRGVLSLLTWIVDQKSGVAGNANPMRYYSTKADENEWSWDIDHIQPGGKADPNSDIHTLGNLVLLYYKHNSYKKDDAPIKKKDVYQGSHLVLTQTLAGITIDQEKHKANNFFKKAGVSAPEVDLSSWNSASIEQRAEFYIGLLRHHLTSLD